jgi:hypothetical protein
MENLTEVQALLITLVLLQLKHFLADFVWQTDKMIEEKGIYGARPGINHSLMHALGTFLAFLWIHPIIAVATAIIDFILHYHIDWAKIQINKRCQYTPKDSKFWYWLGADQMLHQYTYIVLVGWVFLFL